jgi:hypothetical protein
MHRTLLIAILALILAALAVTALLDAPRGARGELPPRAAALEPARKDLAGAAAAPAPVVAPAGTADTAERLPADRAHAAELPPGRATAPGGGPSAPFLVPAGATYVRGRLVDERGRPLGLPVRATFLAGAERRAARADWTPGESGVFHGRVWPADVAHAPTSVALKAGLLRGDAMLPSPLPPGVTDVGEVVLAAAPVIARGVVRDAAGAPVAGAQVVLARPERLPGPELMPLQAEVPRSDATGAFTLRGWSEGAETIELSALHDGYVQHEPVTVRAGAADVVVVMHARGALRVRALVAAGTRPTDLLVRVRSHATGALASARIGAAARPGELAYRVDGADPGPALVEVVYARTGERLAAVDGVVVPSAGVGFDPRLDPLDVRATLHEHRLTFRGADGAPVAPAAVRWRPSGARDWTVHGRSGSKARIVTLAPAIDVQVVADDHRAALVASVAAADGERAIELERGVPVRLLLPLPPGADSRFDLAVQGTASTWMPRRTLALDADGAGTLALGPGRYAAWLADEELGGLRAIEEFEVRDVAREQHVVLERLAGVLREAR